MFLNSRNPICSDNYQTRVAWRFPDKNWTTTPSQNRFPPGNNSHQAAYLYTTPEILVSLHVARFWNFPSIHPPHHPPWTRRWGENQRFIWSATSSLWLPFYSSCSTTERPNNPLYEQKKILGGGSSVRKSCVRSVVCTASLCKGKSIIISEPAGALAPLCEVYDFSGGQ